MARSRAFRVLQFFVVIAAAAGLAAASQAVWLPALARLLVRDDGPAKADIAVVLGGDYHGHRILRAGDLVKQGYVPVVLVSGACQFYDACEPDFEIPYAVRRGYPREWFIPFPNQATNTRDEARAVFPELQRRRVHRFLLVTSDFHSARAGRTFAGVGRSQAPGIEMRVLAATDPEFAPDRWWRFREGRKTVFLEGCKSIAAFIGL